MTKLQIDAI